MSLSGIFDPLVRAWFEENGGGSGGSEADEWIGDGNTHIWISLPEGRLSPMMGVNVNGTVTVDWGDGTEPDVLTGTDYTVTQWTPTHEYAKAGNYVITLAADGVVAIGGASASNTQSYLLRHSSAADGRNNTYRLYVRKIELGNSVVTFGQYALAGFQSVSKVYFPKSLSGFGLASLANWYANPEFTFKGNIGQISASAFANCYAARVYDFTALTTIPTLANANAFSGIPSDCEIRVPAALVDEWKAATNWATYASKIVGV